MDISGVMPVSFGSALRSRRTEMGVSLGSLARMVNYSKSHLSRVETGNKSPTVGLARRCDDVLKAEGTLVRLAAEAPRRSARTAQVPAQLPRVVKDFSGRRQELDALDLALTETCDGEEGRSAVVLLDGPMGVGKTATALHWGHRVAGHFADGTLFADLGGFGPADRPASPRKVLRGFLASLGIPWKTLSGDVQQLSAQFRTALSGKRLLIVLDNAADPEQVRPLLPAGPGCLALVTSRNRMPGLVIRDGARRVTLSAMTAEESRALLKAVSGGAFGETTIERLAEIGCRLPLPMRTAAARHLAFGADRPVEWCDSTSLLSSLSVSGDRADALSELLGWSYRSLGPEPARAFRLLGTGAAARFTAWDAALLLGTGTSEAERLLRELADVHLVGREGGAFAFDPILRAFAVECSRSAEPERTSL